MPQSLADRDDQLRGDFLRLRDLDGLFVLEVAIVEWPGPHTPAIRWTVAQRFASMPSSDDLQRAQRAALENPKFFRICDMCGQRCNIGHMHSRAVCQGCAEELLEIVH